MLKRPAQRAVSGLGSEEIDTAIVALGAVIEPVEIHFGLRPQLDDPDDEFVLEAAVNGRADALVTHNVADFVAAASRFGLTVLTPGAVLKRILS